MYFVFGENRLREANDHVICDDEAAKEIVDCVANFVMYMFENEICFANGFVFERVAEFHCIELKPKESSSGGKRGSRTAQKMKEQCRREQKAASRTSHQ